MTKKKKTKKPKKPKAPAGRQATVERATKETTIELTLNLDGTGQASIDTGIGFLDHMLGALTKHARFDLSLTCKGDLVIDDHHTAEDCALALGQALDQALGERRGIARFGHAYVPLDEALARAVVDLSGRPWPAIDLGLTRERIGAIACENLTHVLQSLAIASRSSLRASPGPQASPIRAPLRAHSRSSPRSLRSHLLRHLLHPPLRLLRLLHRHRPHRHHRLHHRLAHLRDLEHLPHCHSDKR